MSKKGRDWVFRFVVGAPGGPQSSVWRVWNNRSDVYIAHRSMGHINKISIHPLPEANCNYGITGEYAKRHTGSKCDLMRWRRAAVPPAGCGGMAPVLWAVFPTDYLGNDTADLGVRWIPAAPKGTATQISMFFALETRAIVEASLSTTDGRVEKCVSLPNGEAFAIVSSTMSDWKNRDLWLRSSTNTSGPDGHWYGGKYSFPRTSRRRTRPDPSYRRGLREDSVRPS
jgi:hypothetical protein